MKRTIVGYAITYCDNAGLDVPYMFDPDVSGGVCGRWQNEPIALFPDRKSAQRAIRISELAARLAKERGEPANEDFTEPKHRKCIRIVPVEARTPCESVAATWPKTVRACESSPSNTSASTSRTAMAAPSSTQMGPNERFALSPSSD